MTKTQRLALVTRVRGLVSLTRVHPISMGGEAISPTNRLIFSRCVEAWLFLVEDLMLRQGISDTGRIVRMDNFVQSLLSADIVDVLSFLEDLYHRLIADGLTLDTFKQYLDREYSEQIDWRRLLSPINLSVYSFLSETSKDRKAHLLASIAQFLRFPRKLEFQDIGLEDRALEDYEKTEDELAACDYEKVADLIKEIGDIIVEWFGDFHIENLRPSHGPGSVADGNLSVVEKFYNCKIDAMIRILLRNCSLPDSWQDYFPVPPGDGLVRCSRTIFVPKTATKLRTISMEPIALQYIQQGVMYELYRYIDKHPYLGVHIRLSDQAQNQVWALVGSKYHNYGTIDLSHASDSVSWDLVRRVFSRVPHLYRWLLGTRSRFTILPDGRTLRLRKFAPMGSALCFPIECIIFSAVVEHASRKRSLDRPRPNWFWSVYGDDIVCPSAIYEEVILTLQSLGFSVNVRKSYNTGEYRESCGKEYYAGVDITPLYYRTPFYSGRPSPSAFSSWASSANNALLNQLPTYRWYLVSKCLDFSSRAKPYFGYTPNMSPHLYSPQPTNFHVRKRWNKDYQRWEGKFLTVKSRPRACEASDEDIAYFIKLIEMSKRSLNYTQDDESQALFALRGCVEFFSSTALPLQPWVVVDKTITHDWQGT